MDMQWKEILKAQTDHIELAFIGALILHPEDVPKAASVVQPDELASAKNRFAYRLILDLHRAARVVSPEEIVARAEEAGLNGKSGAKLLAHLVQATQQYHQISKLMLLARAVQHAPLRGFTFKVDVSRTYRNKDGYHAGGYKLNTSFKTEEHTIESFVESVVKEGWPYTMVHAKTSPEETGAAARGVKTPKHTENFLSSQLLTGDDDSQKPGVVDFWLNDPFFSKYGLMFVESVNSTAEQQKGHPTLLFDQPVTDPDLFREYLKAFHHAYPRTDKLINIDRTMYNAVGAPVHMLGNICPIGVFERMVLFPFRESKQEEREKRRMARHPVDTADHNGYYETALHGEVTEVASAQEGHRNNTLNTAAFRLGQLLGVGYGDHLETEQMLLDAALRAGLPEYEALKSINSGLMAGMAAPRELDKE